MRINNVIEQVYDIILLMKQKNVRYNYKLMEKENYKNDELLGLTVIEQNKGSIDILLRQK